LDPQNLYGFSPMVHLVLAKVQVRFSPASLLPFDKDRSHVFYFGHFNFTIIDKTRNSVPLLKVSLNAVLTTVVENY
ncbi:hypothetical protein ACDT12_13150, partial [Staphylococcus aureus]